MRLPLKSCLSVTALLLGVNACDSSRAIAPVAPEASVSTSTSSAQTWTVVDLGAPPTYLEFGYFPQAISNAGHLTGFDRIDGFTHAITVTPAGKYTVMRPLPGDVGTYPGQVNALGTTAGISVVDRRYSTRVAVTWDRQGNPTPIPGLPRSDTEDVLLLNDLGMVVGFTKKFDPSYGTGFIWHPSWKEVRRLDMPTPGFYPTMADVNLRGQVVGSVQDLTYAVVGVVWDITGKATVLPNPPGMTSSQANSINDFGVIVGTSGREDGSSVGWLRTTAGGYRLFTPPAGFANFAIASIDNEGRAYGVAYNNDGPQTLYMIKDGRMSPLPTINGGTASTVASNTGLLMGSVSVGGVRHPTIWIPRR